MHDTQCTTDSSGANDSSGNIPAVVFGCLAAIALVLLIVMITRRNHGHTNGGSSRRMTLSGGTVGSTDVQAFMQQTAARGGVNINPAFLETGTVPIATGRELRPVSTLGDRPLPSLGNRPAPSLGDRPPPRVDGSSQV